MEAPKAPNIDTTVVVMKMEWQLRPLLIKKEFNELYTSMRKKFSPGSLQ